MARYADAVVLLPGGRGTADMAAQAALSGIKIHDWRGEE
jgi:predicted Rossmann-fold nucleotide-binding protein